MPSTTFRPACVKDADRIATIYNQYVGGGPYTMEETPWTDEAVANMVSMMGSREVLLAVEVDDCMLGWGQLKRYSPRHGYRICCEISLYLDRDQTGKGLGNPLMEQLIETAKRLDYHHIVAKIIASNEPSIRFHHRHGFETVGVQRQIGIIDGQLADVAILQRLL